MAYRQAPVDCAAAAISSFVLLAPALGFNATEKLVHPHECKGEAFNSMMVQKLALVLKKMPNISVEQLSSAAEFMYRVCISFKEELAAQWDEVPEEEMDRRRVKMALTIASTGILPAFAAASKHLLPLLQHHKQQLQQQHGQVMLSRLAVIGASMLMVYKSCSGLWPSAALNAKAHEPALLAMPALAMEILHAARAAAAAGCIRFKEGRNNVQYAAQAVLEMADHCAFMIREGCPEFTVTPTNPVVLQFVQGTDVHLLLALNLATAVERTYKERKGMAPFPALDGSNKDRGSSIKSSKKTDKKGMSVFPYHLQLLEAVGMQPESLFAETRAKEHAELSSAWLPIAYFTATYACSIVTAKTLRTSGWCTRLLPWVQDGSSSCDLPDAKAGERIGPLPSNVVQLLVSVLAEAIALEPEPASGSYVRLTMTAEYAYKLLGEGPVTQRHMAPSVAAAVLQMLLQTLGPALIHLLQPRAEEGLRKLDVNGVLGYNSVMLYPVLLNVSVRDLALNLCQSPFVAATLIEAGVRADVAQVKAAMYKVAPPSKPLADRVWEAQPVVYRVLLALYGALSGTFARPPSSMAAGNGGEGASCSSSSSSSGSSSRSGTARKVTLSAEEAAAALIAADAGAGELQRRLASLLTTCFKSAAAGVQRQRSADAENDLSAEASISALIASISCQLGQLFGSAASSGGSSLRSSSGSTGSKSSKPSTASCSSTTGAVSSKKGSISASRACDWMVLTGKSLMLLSQTVVPVSDSDSEHLLQQALQHKRGGVWHVLHDRGGGMPLAALLPICLTAVEWLGRQLQTVNVLGQLDETPGSAFAAAHDEAVQQLKQRCTDVEQALSQVIVSLDEFLALPLVGSQPVPSIVGMKVNNFEVRLASKAIDQPRWEAVLQEFRSCWKLLGAFASAVIDHCPVSSCCNNPTCIEPGNMSEWQLVGGVGNVCAGCRMARYCSRACQKAMWAKHHKPVCERLQAVKRA